MRREERTKTATAARTSATQPPPSSKEEPDATNSLGKPSLFVETHREDQESQDESETARIADAKRIRGLEEQVLDLQKRLDAATA